MEKTTVARPYAKAIFETALANNSFETWSDFLALAASITHDAGVQALIANPKVARQEVVKFIISLLNENTDQEAENLLKLLAENHRLTILSEITALYEHLRAEHEKTIEVDVLTAEPLSAQQQASIIEKLTKKLSKKIILKPQIEPTLLGGAIIRAGDLVIDGSVKNKLTRMQQALVN